MKSFVSALFAQVRRSPATAPDYKDVIMRRNWAGLASKLFRTLPILPSNPTWARVAQPERIADERKLLKDETDESLIENFVHEAQEERCRDNGRLQHPAGSVGLWNPPAP
jgi:hypothetical protein